MKVVTIAWIIYACSLMLLCLLVYYDTDGHMRSFWRKRAVTALHERARAPIQKHVFPEKLFFLASETAPNATLVKCEIRGGQEIEVPIELFESRKRGPNNCLFDAVIRSCDPKYDGRSMNSQALREYADTLIQKDGHYPTIPFGQPAGEGYLQILSFIFQCTLSIHTQTNPPQLVRDERVAESAPVFALRHIGTATAGHWMA